MSGKPWLKWLKRKIDWDEFSFTKVITSDDETSGIRQCGHHLHDYELQFQPEMRKLTLEINQLRGNRDSLHAYLYDRPVPVDDVAMLTHRSKVKRLFVLSLLLFVICFAGNVITFMYFGAGIVIASVAALVVASLPVALGHPVFEKIVMTRKILQNAVIIVIAILTLAALFEFGQARKIVMERAIDQPTVNSYVDGASSPDDVAVSVKPQNDTESRARGTLGDASFLMTIAAELGLGLLVGLYTKLKSDPDYAAWRMLSEVIQRTAGRESEMGSLSANIDRAKQQCMAGIRRAQGIRSKRRPPFHKLAIVLALALLFGIKHIAAQSFDGVLIDTSSSIAKGTPTGDLLSQYLRSAKDLLATEPPDTRVWVSTIGNDSFGGPTDIVRGWTPTGHGVFTDNLDRARRQLATTFEGKSASLAATAEGTDIFGGLWRLKILFDAAQTEARSGTHRRTIWIFSDMMNQTPDFDMVQMLGISPERMLERAKAKGAIVPLQGDRIYIYGAVPYSGITPYAWMKIEKFWRMYFAAAGAELVTYSTECDVQRSMN